MTSKSSLSAFENCRYQDAPAPACGKINSVGRSVESRLWNFLIHPGLGPIVLNLRVLVDTMRSAR